jgi:succinate dehydrogenase / fumarate reductase iron-sulfur subunit
LVGEYEVEAEPTERVLDALHYVKYQGSSLALRRSCAHGICGSDALVSNGVNALACKVLVKDLEQPITVEPMHGLPVIRDLVVDMEPFFAGDRAVFPWLITEPREHEPARERHQTPEDRERYDDTTKCILCAECTTSCPIYWAGEEYVAPAAIVNAHPVHLRQPRRGRRRTARDSVVEEGSHQVPSCSSCSAIKTPRRQAWSRA